MNLNDEIAKVAYEIYEKNGCIEGRDLVNWLQAEIIVLARRMKQEAEGRKEMAAGEKRSGKIKPEAKTGRAKKVAVKEKKKAPQKEPGKAAKKSARKKEE